MYSSIPVICLYRETREIIGSSRLDNMERGASGGGLKFLGSEIMVQGNKITSTPDAMPKLIERYDG
jgi:hypothetical protein